MAEIVSTLHIIFVLTTLTTLLLFVWVLKNSRSEKTKKVTPFIVLGLLLWLGIQYLITKAGIYENDTASIPPKIAVFAIFPSFIIILSLFCLKSGRVFIDNLPLKQITYLNIVRIPAEFVLWVLAAFHYISPQMSFEGWNFDILAGLTAPFIAYFGIAKGKINKKWILIWNIISLLLLIAIVVISTLSAPSPFQLISFEPYVSFALFVYPFSWLPTFIVPIILFGHLVSIRQLTRK